MYISQDPSAGYDVVNVLHRVVGLGGRRLVIDHKHDTGHHENDEQRRGGHAQPKGKALFQGPAMNPDAMNVQEEIAEYGLGPRPCGIGLPMAKYGFFDVLG